jgi:hypothetical protein
MHQGCDTFGVSSAPYFDMIRKPAQKFGIREMLDYGCGKRLVHQHFSREFVVREYDPGLPACTVLPDPSHMVIYMDVLDHVEPDLLDNVLDHLANLRR